jgi:hypothetical protein
MVSDQMDVMSFAFSPDRMKLRCRDQVRRGLDHIEQASADCGPDDLGLVGGEPDPCRLAGLFDTAAQVVDLGIRDGFQGSIVQQKSVNPLRLQSLEAFVEAFGEISGLEVPAMAQPV